MQRLTQQELKLASESCASKLKGALPEVNYFTTPYRHCVIDDFLPADMAQSCLNSFPSPEAPGWDIANDKDIEIKQRSTWKSEFDIPDGMIDAVRILNGAHFLQAMTQLIGIQKLVPDPYFSGGGLNITKRGGMLDVHVDGNYHDSSGLNRRLNAIIYLTPGWLPDWGGEFGVYDKTGEVCVKKIAPLFNRLVVFDSHDYSFHGLPDPINFPIDIPRRSLLLYYYTKEPRPPEHVSENAPHSALWKRRNLKDKRGNRTRAYS